MKFYSIFIFIFFLSKTDIKETKVTDGVKHFNRFYVNNLLNEEKGAC